MAEDLYKTLQVDPEAEPEVIQAAYRRLARKYHPDVAGAPEAGGRMAAINRAWAILGDPVRRAAYDRERSAHLQARARAATPPLRHQPAWPMPASGGGPMPAGWPTRAGGPGGPGQAETGSRDWTSGRSTAGSGCDAPTMGTSEGLGAAGPPPGNPSGSVLNFGRYAGWSLGEIARRDVEYLEWLDRAPIGRPYRAELDGLLRRAGRRRAASEGDRRGLFRRR